MSSPATKIRAVPLRYRSAPGVGIVLFRFAHGLRRPAGASSNTAVNQKVEPWPSRLLTPIVPPISSTSCLQIASPSPVPPYLRVVEASAWVKGGNSGAIWSCRMPIPVSVTVKRTVAVRSPLALERGLQRDLPALGELDGVGGRDWSTPGAGGAASPRRNGGISGDTCEWMASPFGARLHAQQPRPRPATVWSQVEAQLLQRDFPRLDLGEVQDVVDQRQQRPPAALSHLGVLPLLRREIGVQQQLRACR